MWWYILGYMDSDSVVNVHEVSLMSSGEARGACGTGRLTWRHGGASEEGHSLLAMGNNLVRHHIVIK